MAEHRSSVVPRLVPVTRSPIVVDLRPWQSIGAAAIALLVFFLGASASYAADIRSDPYRKGFGIILEGRIETGDFNKLQRLIFEDAPSEIYLASSGGDLAEAMKIGHFVRMLKLETVIPTKALSAQLQSRLAARRNIQEENYLCASACFFVFVAGIRRTQDFIGEPILGIHRPYLSQPALKSISSEQAMVAASNAKSVVEKYLKEMSVPQKDLDEMFSISRDSIRLLKPEEFEADFEGFIVELKDWVDTKCDQRSDREKKVWEIIKHKNNAQQSPTERIMSEAIQKKFEAQFKCENETQSELSLRAFQDALKRRK